MTTLRVEWDADRIRQFSVSGHAGFAESGGDIVCAAASVLIFTCINALESVAGIEPLVDQVERNAAITLTMPAGIDSQTADTAQIILRTGLQGFKDLAVSYPMHFKIIDGRKHHG